MPEHVIQVSREGRVLGLNAASCASSNRDKLGWPDGTHQRGVELASAGEERIGRAVTVPCRGCLVAPRSLITPGYDTAGALFTPRMSRSCRRTRLLIRRLGDGQSFRPRRRRDSVPSRSEP